MERTLLVKGEALVYKIPQAQIPTSDWKATAWTLDKPEWTGKLRVVSSGSDCKVLLEEKGTGKVYAECQVPEYPGQSVQTVSDSSRYFVIKASNGNFLGLGFNDRSDSFDLNVALQGHFKGVRVEEEIQREEEQPREQLDLAFKEGQTIKVNINIPKKSGRERSRSPGGPLAPPPSASAVQDTMAAAGLAVVQPKIAAPPQKQANPNWIQF